MLVPCEAAAKKRPLATKTMLNGPTRCKVLYLVFVLLLCHNSAALPPTRYASRIVETKGGQIRGILQELNSKHLEPVEVFRGIPYAAPPVGNLRLRPPSAPRAWNGVKLADTFGPVCPQRFPDISNQTAAHMTMPQGRFAQLPRLFALLRNQSEDCLYLNLYIPGSGSRGLEAPYAVIVYIHGESFEWGSGNFYDGSVLASAGHVIVITLNFRLGVLGFLRTRPIPDKITDSPSGNLALKDIAMGLGWVRENIRAFGGDPSRITVIGHDTGAVLANFLLLAPFGKGQFHRLVLLSGSALSPWATIHDPNDVRNKVAQQLNCSTENEQDIANCVRRVRLEALMNLELPEIRFMPRMGPSLPVDPSNPDPSLAMERESDAFINVPLILGVSSSESYLDFNENDLQYGLEEEQRNRILRTFIRNAYVYHLNEIFSAVRNEYTEWDKAILHPIIIRDSTMEALSDGHTVAPLLRIAFYHARRGAKTYFYHFNYQTRDSDYVQRLGSLRGEDIPYIFGLPLVAGGLFFPQNYSRLDQGVAEAVLTFFTNFAKTGNPNEPHNIESVDYGTIKEKTRFRGLTWEPYETASQQYLMIAPKPKMKSHYRGHKMAVWLNLIPQLHQPGEDDVSMRHHHFRERGEHLYAGPVRDEWYTPMPLVATTKSSSSATTVCTTSSDEDDVGSNGAGRGSLTEDLNSILENTEDDAELLQRLASRHYYSTTTALAITVGVGCILLVLNMLIFAGIYYQRDRDKKRASGGVNCGPNNQESLPLGTRMGTSSSLRANNTSTECSASSSGQVEAPPSYTPLVRSPSAHQEHPRNSTLPRRSHQQQDPNPREGDDRERVGANEGANEEEDEDDEEEEVGEDEDEGDNSAKGMKQQQQVHFHHQHHHQQQQQQQQHHQKDPVPPKPPTRTTSSLSSVSTPATATIKKRVQIQEISV